MEEAIKKIETLRLVSSVARPADTDAYAAGDVISAVTTNKHHEFLSGFRGVFQGSIEYVLCDSSANQGTKPSLELWLFHSALANVADNAAFAPSDKEMLTRIAVIALPDSSWKVGNAGSGANGNSCCEVFLPRPIPFISEIGRI
jgi:hypothetical protein